MACIICCCASFYVMSYGSFCVVYHSVSCSMFCVGYHSMLCVTHVILCHMTCHFMSHDLFLIEKIESTLPICDVWFSTGFLIMVRNFSIFTTKGFLGSLCQPQSTRTFSTVHCSFPFSLGLSPSKRILPDPTYNLKPIITCYSRDEMK